MSKPVAIPNTFATATTVIPLSNLDQNFTAVATSINSALTYSNYAADTGAANAYVVTFTGLAAGYAAGLRIQFKAANANTGASTINVNAQGTKNITFQNAAALTAGIIAANSIVDVMYDGTQFLLMNDPAGLTGGDVVGPASAVNEQITLFDGTSGKLIKAATTGTGVVTALGVNTGSSGAFVVNGGALGTPSSGTVTNFTGTASININGTVGATTPNTGNFTTITATSLIVSKSTGWNQSADTYVTTSSGVSDVHTGMRRCLLRDDGSVNYYLNPSDSTQKVDGSASTLTGADGQVMVEIPAFYVKFTPGTTRTWSISLLPAPGYNLHPAFIKDGVAVPYRYYGAYDGCVNTTGSTYQSGLNWDNNVGVGNGQAWDTATAKLASVSGVFPAVGLTRANARTMASNRGVGWRQVDAYLAWAVELLFLIEYGTFRTQQNIGDGNTNVTNAYNAPSSGSQTDSPHSEAGKSNSIGNASTNTTNGASSASRNTAWMSYRGIENWYGNCYYWVDGFNINSNQGYVSNNEANYADDTATNYNAIGAAMVATDGYVTNCQNEPFAFLPSAVGGSSSTYWADYYAQNSGWRVAGFGGLAASGADAGGFWWYLLNGSSVLGRGVGARLAY